jgi:histidinol-phosphate aminotransferase
MVSNSGKTNLKKILEESQNLSRYDLGETIESLARKLDRKPSEITKLNSNENFFLPLGFLRGLLKEVAEEVDPRLYPAEETGELRKALAKHVGASPEEIVIGTGGDQLIDLVSRMTLRYGDEALSIAPTFSIYEQCTKIQRAVYKSVPLKNDFSLDTEEILSSVTPRTKLLFLCSPNNPTANQFDRKGIERLIQDFVGLVIIDEAYADFAEYSIVDLVEEFENIIVLRTFSKAFGLAGLRLGYAVTNPKLAALILEKLQLPYSVSHVALKLGLKLLERIEPIRNATNKLRQERIELTRVLSQIEGIHAFDSETNFVLFDVGRSSGDVYRELLEKGVIVKNIGRVLHLDNCLRVTVAPHDMSKLFLASLKEVLGENSV